MLRLARPQGKRQRENTLALINVVFLLLIFFLIAGSLTPPMEQGVALVDAERPEPASPPDALAVLSDGTLRFRGETVSAEEHVARLLAEQPDRPLVIRVVPDRELPAASLIDIAAALEAAGAEKVRIVTERARP